MSEDMNLLLRDGIAVEKVLRSQKNFQIRMKNCLLST